MIRSLRESAVFFKEFGSRFETTGSILPSSRFLAKAITRQLAQRNDAPIRVLECGPGTGAFTSRIVRHLRPEDSFDLVELNEAFVRVLRQRFETDPAWKPLAGNSTIHDIPLQQFRPEAPYDFIISGLPHINFPVDIAREITECYQKLLKPGGRLSYFEYMYIRPIRKAVTFGTAGERVRGVDAVMKSHLSRHDVQRDNVFVNFPPAWVQHLRSPGESA